MTLAIANEATATPETIRAEHRAAVQAVALATAEKEAAEADLRKLTAKPATDPDTEWVRRHRLDEARVRVNRCQAAVGSAEAAVHRAAERLALVDQLEAARERYTAIAPEARAALDTLLRLYPELAAASQAEYDANRAIGKSDGAAEFAIGRRLCVLPAVRPMREGTAGLHGLDLLTLDSYLPTKG